MANLSNINNNFIVTDGGNILIGSTVERGIVTIDQLGVNTVGLVINSTSATYPPYLYLRDQGGTGYSEIQANNDLYLNCTNVGIGKPVPVYQLDVLGTGSYGGMIQMENTTANAYPRLAIQSDVKGYHIGVGGSGAGAGYANNLYFYDNNEAAVRMVIDTDGNVGIGTTTPFANATTNTGLNVDTGGHSSLLIGDGINDGGMIQSSDDSQRIIIGANVYDSPTGSWSRWNATGAALIDVYGEANSAFISLNVDDGTSGFPPARLFIDGNGNVGIGTTSPSAQLEVQETGITVANTQDFVASFIGEGYGTGQVLIADSATIAADKGGELQFGGKYTGNSLTEWVTIGGYKDNGTDGQYGGYFKVTTRPNGGGAIERMRITSGGDVYIGNSSVTLANTAIFLQKNGIITSVVGSSSTDLIQFYQQNVGAIGTISRNANGISINGTGQTNQLVVGDSGVVSLGTTSPITDPFVSSNQFQQFQVGKSGVMGSYTNSAGESMFSNNIYVGSTYNTFQALDTSVNGTAMFLYNDYISFKTGTTAANGTVGVAERMRLTNAGELNIGGYGGQFPILKVVGLAGGVHTGSTWSISANQDGIGRTILGTGGQGRAMYFENDGKTVHTQESYFDKGVFLGGSVAANLLDDYEEGTFTATTNNDGVGQPVTARYTKIGQLVTYTVYIPNWSPTSAGTAVIAGFPFTAIISYGYGVGNVTHSTGVLNCSGGYHETTNWNGTLNNSTGRSSWVVASARSIMVTGFYYTSS